MDRTNGITFAAIEEKKASLVRELGECQTEIADFSSGHASVIAAYEKLMEDKQHLVARREALEAQLRLTRELLKDKPVEPESEYNPPPHIL